MLNCRSLEVFVCVRLPRTELIQSVVSYFLKGKMWTKVSLSLSQTYTHTAK